MDISRFEISNYKSFHQTEPVNLTPGFNIIVGRNNSGKTAFLEALSLNFEAKPHRSIATLPIPHAPIEPRSHVDVSFMVSAEEFRNLILRPGQTFYIPMPHPNDRLNETLGRTAGLEKFGKTLFDFLLSNCPLTIKVRALNNNGVLIPRFPSFGIYNLDAQRAIEYRVDKDRNAVPSNEKNDSPPQDVGTTLTSLLRQRIYRFSAERFKIAESRLGPNQVLDLNATNLPEVLSNLQGHPERLRKFNLAVRTVLPEVEQATVFHVSADVGKIMVWPASSGPERDDLAISLAESGTGVGQVIALLYVVMTSQPSVILIDEPQSFLHPGAVRKLIEILKQYPQHQYIIATHSPTVITAANPDTITIVALEGGRSVLKSVDVSNSRNLQICLSEIGARLSDVFGADDIMWVEGSTEEICFPKILERIAKKSLMGTAIVSIRTPENWKGKMRGE